MSKRAQPEVRYAKYTKQQVLEIVESEGLEYAVMDYTRGERIADKKLAELWDNARVAMQEVAKYLGVEV